MLMLPTSVGEYRPFVSDSYVRLRGPLVDESWQAFDGSGRSYRFEHLDGASDDSLWLLTEVVDKTGNNRVELAYAVHHPGLTDSSTTESAGDEVLLSSVRYSFAQPGCPKHEVKLSYAEAHDVTYDGGNSLPTNTTFGFAVAGGAPQLRAHLLTGITVIANQDASCALSGEPIRTMRFGYELVPETHQPRLTAVDMWGRGDSADPAESRPVARYAYGSALTPSPSGDRELRYQELDELALPPTDPDPSLGTWQATDPGFPIRTVQVGTLADFTGDGRDDLAVRLTDSGVVRLARNEPSAVARGHNELSPAIPLPADVVGDRLGADFIDNTTGVGPSNKIAERQLIDWNGDGRLDVLSTTVSPTKWTVWINLPGDGPGGIDWKKTAVDTQPLIDDMKEHVSLDNEDLWHLSPRRTLSQDLCWDQHGDDFTLGCDPGDASVDHRFMEQHHVTDWRLQDVNGDRLPDFVYTSPAQSSRDSLLPSELTVRVLYNRGPQVAPFGGASVILHDRACGVARERRFVREVGDSYGHDVSHIVCAFTDVNGDGLADYVEQSGWQEAPARPYAPTDTRVYLGTGIPNDYRAERSYRLPAPLEATTGRPAACSGGDSYSVKRMSGLVDFTGDGVPDFVYFGLRHLVAGIMPVRGIEPTVGSDQWWIMPGTSTGFAAPIALDAEGFDFQLFQARETCHGARSDIVATIADLDGDGRPEGLRVRDGTVHVAKLVGDSGMGAPAAGRLVRVNNGYGGATALTWGNAKADPYTDHQVPQPEIVVTSIGQVAERGLGRSVEATRFAYGQATWQFAPLLDQWHFAGYARVVALRGTSAKRGKRLVGTAAIQERLVATDLSNGIESIALTGRGARAYVLDGAFESDPIELLPLDPTTDGRTRSGSVRVWDLMVEDRADLADGYDCFGADPTGTEIDVADPALCRTYATPFVRESIDWRGATAPPSPGVPDPTAVQTRTIVQKVDSYARPLMVKLLNDVARDDDDVCARYEYATPAAPGTLRLVLDAIAVARITGCDNANRSLRFAGSRYYYDGRLDNSYDIGLVTREVAEIYLDSGMESPLSETSVHRTYDEFGNATQVSSESLQDGVAVQWTMSAEEFDPFSLVAARRLVSGSDTPTLATDIEYDRTTLEPLEHTEPNGTILRHEFDAFGRPRRHTVQLPDGDEEYLLSELYYLEEPDDTLGRRVIARAYADWTPADASSLDYVQTITHRDELGRSRYIETYLGDDYDGRILVTDLVERDGLGRTVFRAAPFAWSDPVDARYGTTYFYRPDGRLQCAVSGVGRQAYPGSTSNTDDRYVTCFAYDYEDYEAVTRRSGPNENRIGDDRYGIEDEVRISATGWTTTQTRRREALILERTEYAHSRLGMVSEFRRYRDPDDLAPATTWQFQHDSLGRVVSISEPATVDRFFDYDAWGNLRRERWRDTATGNLQQIRMVYDALGRLRKTYERDGATVVPDSATHYYYDEPAEDHPVPATHLLGRLAWVDDPIMRTYFGYTAQGDSAHVARVNKAEGVPFAETRTFSPNRHLESLQFVLPDQASGGVERIHYVYDSAQRVAEVVWEDGHGAESVFTAEAIDDLGRYRRVVLGNGVVNTWSFRPDRRQELLSRSTETAESVRDVLYQGFDGEGRLQGLVETTHHTGASPVSTLTQYQYDDLNRLARSTTTGTAGLVVRDKSYAYDGLGNLRGIEDHLGDDGDRAFSFDPTDPDRLCSVWNPSSSAAPERCNQTTGDFGDAIESRDIEGKIRSFGYDRRRRVRTISSGTAEATIHYSAFGDVAEVNVTGSPSGQNRQDRRYGPLVEKARFLQDGVYVERIERRIPGPLGIVAVRRGVGEAAVTIYQHRDGRGSRFFTDEAGSVVQEVEYADYGEVLTDSGEPGSIEYTKYLWNFGDSLEDFGVTQLGPRLYDPSFGRFLQRDPLLAIRTSGTSNPYAFAFNDPINFLDHTGLDPDDVVYTANDLSDRNLGDASNKRWDPESAPPVEGHHYIGHFYFAAEDTWFPAYAKGAPSSVGTMSDGAVDAVAKPEGGFFSRFLDGIIGGAVDAISGVVNAIWNPLATAEGIVAAVRHPVRTAKAIGSAALEMGEAILSGDPDALGRATFEVGSALLGAQVAKLGKVSKLDDVADLGKVARSGRRGVGAGTGRTGGRVSPFSGLPGRRPDCVKCVTSLVDAIENGDFVLPGKGYPGLTGDFTRDEALDYITEHTGVGFGPSKVNSLGGPGDYVVFNTFVKGRPRHVLWARVRPDGTSYFYDPQIARKVGPGKVGAFEAFPIKR